MSDDAAIVDMRGKEVEVEFEVVEAKRIQVDEISPAMLEDLGFDDTEELRSFVRAELDATIRIPSTTSAAQANRRSVDQGCQLGNARVVGASSNQSRTATHGPGTATQWFQSAASQQLPQRGSRLNARESTIHALREHFVLEKIAEDLKVEPSADDYDKEIELIAEQNDSTPRRIRARLEKSGQMDAIRNQIIERQVIERIVEAGKVTDKEDMSFLKSDPESSDIDFAIAGDYSDIPEAKHDNEATTPGALKLPEKDKSRVVCLGF